MQTSPLMSADMLHKPIGGIYKDGYLLCSTHNGRNYFYDVTFIHGIGARGLLYLTFSEGEYAPVFRQKVGNKVALYCPLFYFI